MLNSNKSLPNRGMTPREIKAELILRGVTLTEIARVAGVTRAAVSQAIYQYSYLRGKGRRIRPYIALALGKKESDIWPDDDSAA